MLREYFKLKNKIRDRYKFVKQVADLMFPQQKCYEGVPYEVNNSDEDWVLDSGNDWRLHFEDDYKFRISYRYGNREDADTFIENKLKVISHYFAAERTEN